MMKSPRGRGVAGAIQPTHGLARRDGTILNGMAGMPECQCLRVILVGDQYHFDAAGLAVVAARLSRNRFSFSMRPRVGTISEISGRDWSVIVGC